MLHSRRYVLTSEVRDTYLVCVANSSIQAVHIGDQENRNKEEDAIPQSEVRCNNFDTTNTWTALTKQTGRLTKREGFVAGVLRVPTDGVVNVDLVNERHGSCAEWVHTTQITCDVEKKKDIGGKTRENMIAKR